MRTINGCLPILLPPHFTQGQVRALAESVGCVLKHDDVTNMYKLVPFDECPRPACDVVTLEPKPRAPKVASIANFQRKEKPESFAAKFKKWTMPDHDPDGPRAA